jgi:hypothetical protein
MSGANEAASNEYARTYGYKVDAAKTQYGGKIERWREENKNRETEALTNYKGRYNQAETQFKSLWDKWKELNTGGTTETVSY